MKRLIETVLIGSILPLFVFLPPGLNSGPIRPQSQQPRVVKLTETGGAYWPSWSPDGERIAYFNRIDSYVTSFAQDRQEPICNLWIMNADGTDARLLWAGEFRGEVGWPMYPPSWSYDGRFIAVDTKLFSTSMIIASADGSRVSGSIFPDSCAAPRFAPSSPQLVFSRLVPDRDGQPPLVDERSVFIMDYETGQERLLRRCNFNSETEWLEWPSVWSRAGRLLRIMDDRQTEAAFHFYSIDTGALVNSSNDPGGGPNLSAAFPDHSRSPSGRWKVYSPRIPDLEYSSLNHGSVGEALTVGAAAEGGAQAPVLNIRAHVFSFQWHPQRDILLFSAGRKSVRPDMTETCNIYLAFFLE
jgi:hypothetical protein